MTRYSLHRPWWRLLHPVFGVGYWMCFVETIFPLGTVPTPALPRFVAERVMISRKVCHSTLAIQTFSFHEP